MPPTDYQGPFGRSFLTLQRDHVHTATDDLAHTSSQDLELEAFQKCVADLFIDLSSSGDLLSIAWIMKLLDVFLICKEDFRLLVLSDRLHADIPASSNRLVLDFFDRCVKALDVCNAIRDGIDQIRQWTILIDIVLIALRPSSHSALGEGHLRRANKALADLAISMIDDKDSVGGVFSHRNRSFGRHGNSNNHRSSSPATRHFRSLSWSVSRTWSATKQIQAIGNNLVPPKTSEITATNGLALPIYTMNSVLLVVMWVLVAAVPCQDRGVQHHFSFPRNLPWAAPVISICDRIMEQSKKKERRSSNGLLMEIEKIERCARTLSELTELNKVEEDKFEEVAEKITNGGTGVSGVVREDYTFELSLPPDHLEVVDQTVQVLRGDEIDSFVESFLVDAVASKVESVTPLSEPGQSISHAVEELEVHGSFVGHIFHSDLPSLKRGADSVPEIHDVTAIDVLRTTMAAIDV